MLKRGGGAGKGVGGQWCTHHCPPTGVGACSGVPCRKVHGQKGWGAVAGVGGSAHTTV